MRKIAKNKKVEKYAQFVHLQQDPDKKSTSCNTASCTYIILEK